MVDGWLLLWCYLRRPLKAIDSAVSDLSEAISGFPMVVSLTSLLDRWEELVVTNSCLR